jgi:hypothetical protein
LKTRVKVRGLHAVDRRTAAARALFAWRDELITDLGGKAAVSAQQRALIDLATRTKLYLDTLDAWLMEQPSLVVTKRRAVVPVLRERQQLADALARNLLALGLERKSRPVQSLAEYVAQTYGSEAESGEETPRSANRTAARSGPSPAADASSKADGSAEEQQ